MKNLEMKQKLANGDAINIRILGKEVLTGLYELNSFTNDVSDIDYCDAQRELWISSICKNKASGRILASTALNFHLNPEFECIWLR